MSLVISHRGANLEAPENTLPAFAKALEYNVDGFENDVHLTADGVLVVLHDDTIDRTSNGTGNVCEMNFDDLRKLDFGSWFGSEFKGTQIPALAEFFELCGSLKIINVEIKEEINGSKAAGAAVVKLAKEMGVFDRLLISSFDMAMLQAALAEDPTTKVAFLFAMNSELAEEVYDDPAAFAKKYNLTAFHPFADMCSADFIEECHEAGVQVNPWTVNHERGITALRDWGADCVITDEPALAMRINHGE